MATVTNGAPSRTLGGAALVVPAVRLSSAWPPGASAALSKRDHLSVYSIGVVDARPASRAAFLNVSTPSGPRTGSTIGLRPVNQCLTTLSRRLMIVDAMYSAARVSRYRAFA